MVSIRQRKNKICPQNIAALATFSILNRICAMRTETAHCAQNHDFYVSKSGSKRLHTRLHSFIRIQSKAQASSITALCIPCIKIYFLQIKMKHTDSFCVIKDHDLQSSHDYTKQVIRDKRSIWTGKVIKFHNKILSYLIDPHCCNHTALLYALFNFRKLADFKFLCSIIFQ